MNPTLEAAITAHVLWRLRISALLSRGDISEIDRNEVVSDGLCDLGKWIYGPGSVLNTHKEFQEFHECHRRFHLSIGSIIDKIRDGNMAAAKDEMKNGAFAYCSQDLVAKIIELDRLGIPGQS